jgi:hypothetical protein
MEGEFQMADTGEILPAGTFKASAVCDVMRAGKYLRKNTSNKKEEQKMTVGEQRTIVYEYVMTSDSGFAPNPFHGTCTLACCKPKIRKSVANEIFGEIFGKIKAELASELASGPASEPASSERLTKKNKEKILKGLGLDATEEETKNFDSQIKNLFLHGDERLLARIDCQSKKAFIKNQNIYIIGLAGKQLKEKLGKVREDKNPMVYVMRVTDILTYDQYYHDDKYEEKIPHGFNVVDANDNTSINWCGDNIYKSVEGQNPDEGELAVKTAFHHENGCVKENKEHDLSGEYVLVSDAENFIYYGKKAGEAPDIGEPYKYAGHKKFNFCGESGDNKELKEFLDCFDKIEEKGIIAPPINSMIRMEDIR